MAYVEMKDVSVGFGSGTNRTEVLTDINLEMEKGEFVAILGYSGTGKSTLMNLLAGLIKPDKGEVIVDGKKVDGPHPDRGLVFQNYSLLPWMNVHKNVSLAVDEVFAGETQSQRDQRVFKAVDRVNLTDALHKKPGELSGGMRQRNSVARTLSMNPKLLLLDEPLSALDALTRAVIQDQILEIQKAEGQTIVLITNDVDEALYMADRIIPLSVIPPVTFGPTIKVSEPRPRDRKKIIHDLQYQQWRTDVITFLLEEKEKEKATGSQKKVTLPNIKPMDISRHRPTFYKGGRPKRKHSVGAA